VWGLFFSMVVFLSTLLIFGQAEIFEIEQQKDMEIIMAEIEELKRRPLNINTASLDDLIKIPYLSQSSCLRIIEYRKTNGPFNSLDELLNISGITEEILNRIEPFLVIEKKKVRLENFTLRFRVKTSLPRTENSPGYYIRLRGKVDDYDGYFISEKDPYEKTFFDYWAGGIVINENSRRFAFGKYNLDLGHGVIMSPLGSIFSGVDFKLIMRERGIIPYTSSLENQGFFGAALSDSLFLKYALFYSNQKLDGRVDTMGFAHSFDESGTHTDSLSLSKKDRINEELFGYDLRYNFSSVEFSHRSYWCEYTPPFVCDDSLFEFYGNHFWVTGGGFKCKTDNFIFFGEIGHSRKHRIGGLLGYSSFLPYIDFNLVGKYFPLGFYSPKGAEVEKDYAGGAIHLAHHSRILNVGTTLAMDNKLEDDATKYDLRFQFEKTLGILNARFVLRYRYNKEWMDISGSQIFLRITPLKMIFCDIRLQERYTYNLSEIEKGKLACIELGSNLKWLQLRARYGVFDTDSYTSRIYVYETDLPGVVNNRILYNKGDYGFVYLAAKVVKRTSFSLKYSVINTDSLFRNIGLQLDIKL